MVRTASGMDCPGFDTIRHALTRNYGVFQADL